MIETTSNGLVVTSETIASGTDNQHKNVLQLIRTYRDDLLEFGSLESETRNSGSLGGRPAEVFFLNEPQSTLLLTYMRNMDRIRQFKKALVKAFFEMAEKLKAPAFDPASLTRADILKLAIEADNEARELRSVIEANAGKVLYIDNHVNPEDVMMFRLAARNLHVNESDLRKALIYRNWIYVSGIRKSKGITAKRYSGYQKYQNYFKHCITHEVATVNGTPWHTLKFTPEGVSAVTRLVDRLTTEYGSLRAALPHLEAIYNARKGITA